MTVKHEPRVGTLKEALSILERAHTRDDEMVGFTVERSPAPELTGISPTDYWDAWRMVREFVRSPVLDPWPMTWDPFEQKLRDMRGGGHGGEQA
jgi:hypothetical protein